MFFNKKAVSKYMAVIYALALIQNLQIVKTA